MRDPPPLARGNIRMAFLRNPVVTGAELSKVCGEPSRQYDLPGSPADVHPAQADFVTHMDATKFVEAQGNILQFAITRSRASRATAWRSGAPFTSTHEGALKWVGEEIAHIQGEEDEKHMEHLRSAMARSRGATFKSQAVPAARCDELNEIYELLQVRSGATRQRLGEMTGRA